jgi:hypothetical protein
MNTKKALLLAAAVYNIGFATFAIVDSSPLTSFLGITGVSHKTVVRLMIPVIAMGLWYLAAYYRDGGAFRTLFIGLLTKLGPPYAALSGVLFYGANVNWLLLVAVNDVVWWYPFVRELSKESGFNGPVAWCTQRVFAKALDDSITSAALAISITGALGHLMTLLSVEGARHYGGALFLTSPFFLSLCRSPRRLSKPADARRMYRNRCHALRSVARRSLSNGGRGNYLHCARFSVGAVSQRPR